MNKKDQSRRYREAKDVGETVDRAIREAQSADAASAAGTDRPRGRLTVLAGTTLGMMLANVPTLLLGERIAPRALGRRAHPRGPGLRRSGFATLAGRTEARQASSQAASGTCRNRVIDQCVQKVTDTVPVTSDTPVNVQSRLVVQLG